MKKFGIVFWITVLIVLSGLQYTAFGQCENGQCQIPNYQPSQEIEYGGWRAHRPTQIDQKQPVVSWRYARRIGHYRSVVRIKGETGRSENYFGSGCVIRWGKRVVIITASHVIRGVRRVFIRGRLRWQSCKVIGNNPDWDVAILEPTDLKDLDVAELAYSQDGQLKIGDRLESCGFGSDDKLAVNTGTLKGFNFSQKSNVPDWLMLSGIARQGDSGGPVFRNKKVVGVLWGTNNKIVQATQLGRLHVILTKALGPAEKQAAEKRNIVGINTGLFDGCRPQQRQPTPIPQQPPQINVQSDPRVGNALIGIDNKLNQVIVNTTPQIEATEPEEKDGPKPIVLAVIALIGVVAAFVLYFANEKGA